MARPPYRLNRFFIAVAGAGARDFLQGLLTQDVARLAQEPALYAGLLTPQGKLIADMFLWRQGESDVLIEADVSRGPDLLRRLAMYKLRAPVDVRDASADFCAVLHAEAGASVDPRMPDGALGHRGFVTAADGALFEDGAAAYRALRIAAGVPDLNEDAASEEVFALEALFEELHGVDFKKGCFVGQENASRMKRRATTRKKFCPLAFEGEAPPFDTPVLAGEAEVGRVRSGAAGRAIALLRLDRALEAEGKGLELSAEGKRVRLDPPGWLLLPQEKDEG